jgi:SAM-dependent methyltransferase/tetratricopeptide (TPR) repeat protein
LKSQRNKAAGALKSAVSFFQQGKLKAAEGRLLAALKFDPNLADAHTNLGVLYYHMGQSAAALASFARGFSLTPKDTETARNLASVALELGEHSAALPALTLLNHTQPRNAALKLRLAETYANVGDLNKALGLTEALLIDAPGEIQLLQAKAQLLNANGDHAGALAALREARAQGASEKSLLPIIADCLERARITAFDPQTHAELLACLNSDEIESQALARAAAQMLTAQFESTRVAGATLDSLSAARWPQEPLLLELLERAVNISPRLEAWLINDRRLLRAHWTEHGTLPETWRPLALQIAKQCWNNEYVWAEDADFVSLRPALLACMRRNDPTAATDAFVVWCLHAAPSQHASEALTKERCSAQAESFWTSAVEGPLQERRIAGGIVEASLADEVSTAVRAQYEESPYPRWVELGKQPEEAAPVMLARTFPGYLRAQAPALDGILIAGCGSGHHALQVARQNPKTSVVAIDLSVASLAHGIRRSEELGIDNVEFKHLDLLNVSDLKREFAIIESFGVLHHMQTPERGLAALRSVLAPGGALKLGLYSATARAVVNVARERITSQGLDASPEHVRAFRERILSGDESGLESLNESSDFYSTSTCRDLLFHVHEHQFTPPQLGQMLERAALRFLGFQFVNRSIPNRYASAYPEDSALTDLDSWYAFEREHPNIFARCFLLWAQAC